MHCGGLSRGRKKGHGLGSSIHNEIDGLVVGKDGHGNRGIGPTNDGLATLGGLPLAYDPAAGEQWTMVCKYLITNIKWLITYAAKHVDR